MAKRSRCRKAAPPFLLLLALTAACGGLGKSRPAQAAAPTAAEPAGADPTRVAASELFVFHSDPRLNLHHFLYQWATAEAVDGGKFRAGRLDVVERDEVGELDAAEDAAWRAALAHYKGEPIRRNLLFDDAMLALRDRLLGLRPADDPALESGLTGATVAALDSVEEIYRRHWWPRHDEANRRWAAALLPLLREEEAAMARHVAGAFGGTWPERKIRVDLSFYANFVGAYTSRNVAGDAPHPTVAVGDEGLALPWALEMVFHESSHFDSLSGALRNDLRRAFAAAGAELPGHLSHAALFHTVGHVARTTWARRGEAGYVPYADHNGLWERGWSRAHEVLSAAWQTYLDGEVSREEAVAAVAAAYAAQAPPAAAEGGGGH